MRDASRALTADLRSRVSSVEGNRGRNQRPSLTWALSLSFRRGIVPRSGSSSGRENGEQRLPSRKFDEQGKSHARIKSPLARDKGGGFLKGSAVSRFDISVRLRHAVRDNAPPLQGSSRIEIKQRITIRE